MADLTYSLNVLATLYFMGELLFQADASKKVLDAMEGGFASLVEDLKSRNPKALVSTLASFAGYCAAASFALIFVLGLANVQPNNLSRLAVNSFGLSIATWAAMAWILHHRRIFREYIGFIAFFGGGSLLFPVMDLLGGTNITNLVYSEMERTLGQLLPIFHANGGLFVQAMTVSGFYAGFLIATYIMAWAYALPVAVIIIVACAVPVYVAKFVHRAFPSRPLASIAVVVWLVTQYQLAYGG